MAQLKRDGKSHLAFDQTFVGVKAVNGKVVAIKLAGNSAAGHGEIRFAFKHILDKSSKHADDDDKLRNRVWHRVDKSGTKPDTRTTGPKTDGLSRGKKYADALKYDGADKEKMKNTAIYLSILDLDTVLAEMANALSFHNWGAGTESLVSFEFSKPCIKTSSGAGHITGPYSNCELKVYKVAADSYELGHLQNAS